MNKIITEIAKTPSKFELDTDMKIKLTDFIIDYYIKEYKHLYKFPKDGNLQEGIDWLHNDLLQFIGRKWDLIKDNDTKGMKNWEELNKLLIKNKYPNKASIQKFILKLPNKDFHAFLGNTVKHHVLKSPETFFDLLENK